MSEEARDPELEALFSEAAGEDLPRKEFSSNVLAGTRRLKRRRILSRASLALVLGLVAMPLQDLALATTELLVISLVEIDNVLLAELLAPVNSVGSVLSLSLLALRAYYRRLFT